MRTFQVLVTFAETGDRVGLNIGFSEEPTPEELTARVRSSVFGDAESYTFFLHQIDASVTDAKEWRARWAR